MRTEPNIAVREISTHVQEMATCGIPHPQVAVIRAIAACSPAICLSPVTRENILSEIAALTAADRKFTMSLLVPDRHNIVVIGKGGITDEVILEHELGHAREQHLTTRLGKVDLLYMEMEADRHAAYTWGLDETLKAAMKVIMATCRARKTCGLEWVDLIETNRPRLMALGATLEEIDNYFSMI